MKKHLAIIALAFATIAMSSAQAEGLHADRAQQVTVNIAANVSMAITLNIPCDVKQQPNVIAALLGGKNEALKQYHDPLGYVTSATHAVNYKHGKKTIIWKIHL
jgi:hypothetical protein